MAAMVIRIPKKKRILGSSILVSALNVGLVWELVAVISVNENCRLLMISAMMEIKPNENIIPMYGGKCVAIFIIGTRMIKNNPRIKIITLCFFVFSLESGC